jgi:hypothetical protein
MVSKEKAPAGEAEAHHRDFTAIAGRGTALFHVERGRKALKAEMQVNTFPAQ